ncbi:hypothetical protein B6N60_00284 [Richelia sinica FACHB-800]|uniref:NYN domain-containing protein n=1 Tax=Richelia sinica FACHB-800 TaxID=1357546 RepID=A0A975T3T3_9NOST|nr:NYN domain-containing protein [Richelia sinica]MBD2665842.1 NYN domain-containing protein [Richelia sinica FACHB-800]QXE21607.1 hypothetical protein B6N60_00284 [Richelia sinica FACHB-800]
MPNNDGLQPAYDTAQLKNIATYICHTIVEIQKHHPDLLLEKYRTIQWHLPGNQSALINKFVSLLSQTKSWDELIQKIQLSLNAIFLEKSTNSQIITDLISKINLLNPHIHQLNIPHEATINSSSKSNSLGIAVILLDAENLNLNLSTEKFLATICTCPIQVKIAFANWSIRGKLDVELHERGYDLIHVPAGKDNADGKMIAFGSSIHERYPKAKEVFVCSSDKVMTNLCNHLQQHGLIVYQVSQQGDHINLFNSSTGKTTTYSLKHIPDLASLVPILKSLVELERQSTGSQWIKVSKVFQLLNAKHKINMSQVIAAHLPGKKPKDIFANYPEDFVLHKTDDSSEFYVTVFDHQPLHKNDNEPAKISSEKVYDLKIDSAIALENSIKQIIENCNQLDIDGYIDVGIVATKFKSQYNKAITVQIKQLQINGNFPKFLQSCHSFKLKQTEIGWKVGLR